MKSTSLFFLIATIGLFLVSNAYAQNNNGNNEDENDGKESFNELLFLIAAATAVEIKPIDLDHYVSFKSSKIEFLFDSSSSFVTNPFCERISCLF